MKAPVDSSLAEIPLVARLEVLAAAVLFSTGGAVIKATSFTGWQVASFRCGVGALAIALLLPEARKNWSWRTLLVGCAYAGALVTYAVANKLTSAASTIFLYSTAPLYILVLSPLLLKEPVRRRNVVFAGFFAAGIALMFVEVETATVSAPDPIKGNLVAAIGALSFGLAIIGLRWLVRASPVSRGSSMAAVLVGNLLAFVVCLPAALPVRGTRGMDWVLIAFLGAVQIGLSYFLLTSALRRVSAFEVSLLLLVEPVLNPLWAWWLHAELPNRWVLAGGCIVLMVTVAMTLASARKAAYLDRTSRPTGQ